MKVLKKGTLSSDDRPSFSYYLRSRWDSESRGDYICACVEKDEFAASILGKRDR